jgi:pullulanase
MVKLNDLVIIGVAAATVVSCAPAKNEYTSFELYPVRSGSLTEMEYAPEATQFTLWAPTADEVRLMLYEAGEGGHAYETVSMERAEEGTWKTKVEKDLKGKFYTFNVKIDGKWQGDTPGINAKAVGVNGKRAAIIDLRETDPEGWAEDKRPPLASPADIIIYEVHHRDFSVHPSSGIEHKGKFLAMTETGTKNSGGMATGIDHLKELGVTHVHILPSYDYASVDETRLDENKYNWGYDPLNYNVPEGSYSIDPYRPEVRIREFKQMVQALHKAGIRVVLDVVYNHTFNTAESNFERTVPGYFYRQRPDGTLADASACGNETASNRPMMRKYMIESVLYWINEYHIDGFRFDLMGIHDIETMNEIRKAASAIDPTIFIYGEGWAASAPQMPEDSLAMKANVYKMPGIAAFSDEMRDALRGPFNNNEQGAFLAGLPGGEESIKFGIAGAVKHPQVNNDSVNYSKAPWAGQPTQMISYVSCHDDMCLVDRLKASVPGITPEELVRLDKLAQTAVFTSQGVPFIYAGEEVMRDKKGVHNSYQSPDSINAIDWDRKTLNADAFAYYKGLIHLRRNHPAFRLGDAELVRKHLEFLPVEGTNLVAYRLKDHAGGDTWKDIIVVLNARREVASLSVPEGKYTVVCQNGLVNEKGLATIYGPSLKVAPQSAMIIYQ